MGVGQSGVLELEKDELQSGTEWYRGVGGGFLKLEKDAEWYRVVQSELQKRADCADQSVLFFLASANFWEKHAKNCAIMSMALITYAIAH